MKRTRTFLVKRPSCWKPAAQVVMRKLKPGTVVALSGPLGAGKTTFVQALARALGAKKIPRSPTFSLVRTYRVAKNDIKRLVHVDAYRIEKPRDLLALNLDEEIAEPGTVLVIEWPENAPTWIKRQADVIPVTIQITSSGERKIFIHRDR